MGLLAASAAPGRSGDYVAPALTPKAVIQKTFGIDLNIAGGMGNSQDDPVIMLDRDPAKASLALDRLLYLLGESRGLRWRTLSRSAVTGADVQEIQLALEPDNCTGAARAVIYVSYPAGKGKALPPGSLRIAASAPPLPTELGWLHLWAQINGATPYPGGGRQFRYRTAGVEAVLDIYDLGLPPAQIGMDSPAFRRQLEKVQARMIHDHPKAKPSGPADEDSALYQQTYRHDGQTSVVGLGVYGGRFLELRVTSDDGSPGAANAAAQSIDAIMWLIAPPR